ncbi:hypothetical protein TB2_023632 [Malus domestica]
MNQKYKNACFPKYITNWAKFELVLCDCSLTRAGLGVPWASLGGLNGGAAVVAGIGGGKDGGLEVGLGGGGLRIDVAELEEAGLRLMLAETRSNLSLHALHISGMKHDL